MVKNTQRKLDPKVAYNEGRTTSYTASSTCVLLSTRDVAWGSLDLLVDPDVDTMPLGLLPHSLQHDKLRIRAPLASCSTQEEW